MLRFVGDGVHPKSPPFFNAIVFLLCAFLLPKSARSLEMSGSVL